MTKGRHYVLCLRHHLQWGRWPVAGY